MEYIAHRINTKSDLEKVSSEYGVELDLRDKNDKIIICHNPFEDGDDFEEYLKSYKHGTIILNIKSERIELRILELLKKYKIANYFFLDSSFPMIYQLSQSGEKNLAVRYSEFETIESVLKMQSRINWVWVDCFSKLPITYDDYKLLKDKGFKLCLVSPELQGRDADIEIYKKYLNDNKIIFDAICTKVYNIERWKNF